MLQLKSVVGKSTQLYTINTFHRRLTNGMSLRATVADRPQAGMLIGHGDQRYVTGVKQDGHES